MATKLPAPGDPNALYVVDLTGYVYRAYHALPPLSTSRGEPTHAVYGVTQMLLKLVTQQKLPVHNFVTHTFSFDEMTAAYETFGDAAHTQALKVMIGR